MKVIEECFSKVKKDCFKFIKSQETATEKFGNKDGMLKSFLIPMCFWIVKKTNNKNPYFVGLAGGQGTGKTTISSIIKIILEKYFKLKVFKISIDDFYRTRKDKGAVASSYSYVCKDCTIKKVVEDRKKKNPMTDWEYPDW